MQVARGGQAERTLQHDLARRGIEQVGATDDVGDALVGIVDHHRQLVCPETVGAKQDKVADFSRHVLPHRTLQAIDEADCAAIRHAQAERRLRAWRCGHAASMDAALRGQRAAAAGAGKGQPRVEQALEGGPVQVVAVALPDHGPVRNEAEGGQVASCAVAAPAISRGGSRSSIRTSHSPPARRASSQLPNAASSEPKCRGPVGEGAKRPR